MQTYLRDPEDPYAPEVYLGVGDALGDIDTQEFTWSYRTIQEPDLGKEIRILQCWLCPSCGNNWAEIVVRHGAIEGVSAAPLTRALLERSHLIDTTDAQCLVSILNGRTLRDLIETQTDVVQLLREKLP